MIFLTIQRRNNAGVPIPSQPKIFPAVFPNVLIDQLKNEEIMPAVLLKKPS